jgi:hypothetical protein
MFKQASDRVLDRSGAPVYTWILRLQYACYLLNHALNNTLDGVPLQLLSGVTVDISHLVRFHFWKKVYYKSAKMVFH